MAGLISLIFYGGQHELADANLLANAGCCLQFPAPVGKKTWEVFEV